MEYFTDANDKRTRGSGGEKGEKERKKDAEGEYKRERLIIEV